MQGDCGACIQVGDGMVGPEYKTAHALALVFCMMIHIKRVYETPAKEDGARFLVERLWPRGIKKEALPMKAWCKDVAPSADLRRWFSHDPAKWKEFQARYRAELDKNPAAWQPLRDAARLGPITLLYSSHDTEHNSAVVLASYLGKHSAAAAKHQTHAAKSGAS